jgi:hypothetical protein
MTMKELADQVEAATGPDRDIDHAIANLTNYATVGEVLTYTASLDAAMTLVPENCAVDIDNGPSHWICLGKQAPMGRADVKYPKPGYDGEGDSWLTVSAIAKTMPLALCAAALRAIASQETTR